MPERARPVAYELGRDYTTAEVIVIARRATFDPGAFCGRRREHDGPESLERWQARAVVIALGPNGPTFEPQWSNLEQAVNNLADEEAAAVNCAHSVQTRDDYDWWRCDLCGAASRGRSLEGRLEVPDGH